MEQEVPPYPGTAEVTEEEEESEYEQEEEVMAVAAHLQLTRLADARLLFMLAGSLALQAMAFLAGRWC